MSIKLTITNEKFIFSKNNKDLVLTKDDNQVLLGSQHSKISKDEHTLKTITIEGIVGTIQLISGFYLIVYRESSAAAKILGNEVRRCEQFELIPFHPNQQSLVNIPEQHVEESTISKLRWILSNREFFYGASSSFDATQTLQRWSTIKDSGKPICQTADPRFFWNRDYLESWVERSQQGESDIDQWIVPIFMGFAETRQISNGVQFTLISRRNLNRAGTRYYVRGIDAQGNVANAVETEQIIEISKDTYTSFVQVRGSIPLYWSQFPDLKYKPKTSFYGDKQQNQKPMSLHFKQLNQTYGNVTAVNLIDKKGTELKLGEAYEQGLKELKTDGAKFIWFDFHSICSKMRYDKISLLINQIQQDIDSNAFFAVINGKIVTRQSGVIRTNCIDNLDRTNVVQSVITRTSLANQLSHLKQLSPSTFSDDTFNHSFKNVWANHGDTISLQYSGTGALKNDYTRTGKRTMMGSVKDGENSLARYYLNNFKDGHRQDAYHLFTHHKELSLNKTNSDNHGTQTPSPILYVALFILLAFVFWSAKINSVFLSLIFWAIVLFVSKTFVMKNQAKIVDKPTLFPLESAYPPIRTN